MEHFNNDVVPDRTTMRDRVIIRAAAQAKGYREGLEKRGLHAEYALMELSPPERRRVWMILKFIYPLGIISA